METAFGVEVISLQRELRQNPSAGDVRDGHVAKKVAIDGGVVEQVFDMPLAVGEGFDIHVEEE